MSLPNHFYKRVLDARRENSTIPIYDWEMLQLGQDKIRQLLPGLYSIHLDNFIVKI